MRPLYLHQKHCTEVCWVFTGDIILYDGHLVVYKHSLDLIFYILGGASENELMLQAALSAFSDAVHMLLRNQVEKRALLENLDLVVLCLDETIDDGCVPPTKHEHTLFAQRPFGHEQCDRGDRLDHDCVPRKQAKSGHDGDCDQRADDHERVPDYEGEDAAAHRAAIVVCRVPMFLCYYPDSFDHFLIYWKSPRGRSLERTRTGCH